MTAPSFVRIALDIIFCVILIAPVSYCLLVHCIVDIFIISLRELLDLSPSNSNLRTKMWA